MLKTGYLGEEEYVAAGRLRSDSITCPGHHRAGSRSSVRAQPWRHRRTDHEGGVGGPPGDGRRPAPPCQRFSQTSPPT